MTESGLVKASVGPATMPFPVLRSTATLLYAGPPVRDGHVSASVAVQVADRDAERAACVRERNGEPVRCAKRPSPFPRKTDALFELSFAVARSACRRRSRRRSRCWRARSRRPRHLPRGTATRSPGGSPRCHCCRFRAARSRCSTCGWPRRCPASRPRSGPRPRAPAEGPPPVGNGEPGAAANCPLPVPTRDPESPSVGDVGGGEVGQPVRVEVSGRDVDVAGGRGDPASPPPPLKPPAPLPR